MAMFQFALAIFRSALSERLVNLFPLQPSTFLAGILGRQSADSRPIELIASMGH